MSLRTTAATRFDTFDLYTTSYKKIGDDEIEVNVLVPKDITPGKRPVMIKWHGGGLVSNFTQTHLVPFLTLPFRRQAQQYTPPGSQATSSPSSTETTQLPSSQTTA
jgi:hypothetical protein